MPDPWPSIAGEAMARLSEARSAWIAYRNARTEQEHWAAVERLDAALAVKEDADDA